MIRRPPGAPPFPARTRFAAGGQRGRARPGPGRPPPRDRRRPRALRRPRGGLLPARRPPRHRRGPGRGAHAGRGGAVVPAAGRPAFHGRRAHRRAGTRVRSGAPSAAPSRRLRRRVPLDGGAVRRVAPRRSVRTPTGRRPEVERLTTLDASFLYLEKPDNPMHVAGVLVLEPPEGGLDALASLLEARLPLVPRYRQRVLEVPGHLANPTC